MNKIDIQQPAGLMDGVLQTVGLTTRQVGVVSGLFFAGGLIGILRVRQAIQRSTSRPRDACATEERQCPTT